MLQSEPRPRDRKVAHLELRLTDEDSAVGVGTRPELHFQHEVFREFAGRHELPVGPFLARHRDDQPAVAHGKPSIVAHRLAVKGRLIQVAPAGQIAAVKQTLESGLGRKIIGPRRCEPDGFHDRPQCGGQFDVPRRIRMQQIGKLLGLRVALGVGEQRPRVHQGDLGLILEQRVAELVDLFNLVGRTLLRRRTRKHIAQHDRHCGVVRFQRREDQLEIARRGFWRRGFFEIVRADEQHNAARLQRNNVLLQAEQHAAGRVAADAAIDGPNSGEKLV